MKFRDWKAWYVTAPPYLKFYIWLILLRPVIDNFYYFKEISPFASPLYIAGVLSFVVMCACVIFKKKTSPETGIDILFSILFFIIVTGILLIVTRDFASLETYRLILKIINPFLLFLFFRRVIRHTADLDGILMAFLYSAILIGGFLVYEVAVNPIKIITTRGLERLEGAFADVLNYSIYIILSVLISSFFLLRKSTSLSRRTRVFLFYVILIFSILVLPKINHAATVGILGFLVMLLIFFNFRINFIYATLFLVFSVLIIQTYGDEIYENAIHPLIKTELDVFTGEREKSQALHGRMGRWERMWNEFSDRSILIQNIGLPFGSGFEYFFISGGTHNDFLRIIFMTGFLGFSVYLLWILNILLRCIRLNPAYQFLALGALGTLLLYSISTVPTLYISLMNILTAIFAFICLPERHIRSLH